MTPDQANHRAGGRRAYNSKRKYLAIGRRTRLLQLCKTHDLNPFAHGSAAILAALLGVHRGTVLRDIDLLMQEGLLAAAGQQLCPCCGTSVSPDRLDFRRVLGILVACTDPASPSRILLGKLWDDMVQGRMDHD